MAASPVTLPPSHCSKDVLGDLPSFPAEAGNDMVACAASLPQTVATDVATSSACSSTEVHSASMDFDDIRPSSMDFLLFRTNYLLVTLVVFLADGLQGTHLYVLYEGYGYSVASLYCLGFIAGAISAPITGPLIDRFGRKKSALAYCALEIGINMLEQKPFLAGLIISRIVGGITTNLLSSVFETWLDTEYRRRGFDSAEYETVMRDSVVVGNIAAILSGYLAHMLAERFGPVGPFEGAVSCTAIAFIVIMGAWNENYGNSATTKAAAQPAAPSAMTTSTSAPSEAVVAPADSPESKSTSDYLAGAIESFRSDSRMLRVGIIQGLTLGSVHIFVFLWSPTLAQMAKHAMAGTLGLDRNGEPAYGLIFGGFMAAGVVGGLCSPLFRKAVAALLSPEPKATVDGQPTIVRIPLDDVKDRPRSVEFLAACCYLGSALMLMVPFFIPADSLTSASFSICIAAFLVYEILVGIYMPCEGVIRSLYMPSNGRASMMILPRIIVNVAVAIGVASTNIVSMQTAFGVIAGLMIISCVLQLSLVSTDEWECLVGRAHGLWEAPPTPKEKSQ